jgi:hypothetical protein
LNQQDARPAAAEALRGLIDAIVLKPSEDGGSLGIFVEGNLAAMLRLAVHDKRPSERDSLEQIFPVMMVAGAGLNPRPLGYEPEVIGQPARTTDNHKQFS